MGWFQKSLERAVMNDPVIGHYREKIDTSGGIDMQISARKL